MAHTHELKTHKDTNAARQYVQKQSTRQKLIHLYRPTKQDRRREEREREKRKQPHNVIYITKKELHKLST